jgi:hypothetical protein
LTSAQKYAIVGQIYAHVCRRAELVAVPITVTAKVAGVIPQGRKEAILVIDLEPITEFAT